ncbi:MAG: type IV pilus assembly protein PilM [Clostridiaceae bacterium]|nr:type IV pilus assembly protein PilM [Clostridiaceae bacterium]
MQKQLFSLLEGNSLSIDIGNYQIKIIEGRQQLQQIKVKQAWQMNTPADSYQDGQIINLERLREVIYSHISKENIKAKNVVFTLDSTSVINREILLPPAKPKELESMLEYELHQHMPVDLKEYVVQKKIIGETEVDGIKKIKTLVTAMPKIIVENYIQLANNLYLKPKALDVHFNCLDKFLGLKGSINDKRQLNTSTLVLLGIGHDSIQLTLMEEGKHEFNRLLTIGSKEIDLNIANSFNLTLQEAQDKKHRIAPIYEEAEDITMNIVIEMVRNTVDQWINEIDRVFKYYTSRSAGNRIEGILLYGGGAKLNGLSEYLENYFDIPTSLIDKVSDVCCEGIEKEFQVAEFVNAIGAIIRR